MSRSPRKGGWLAEPDQEGIVTILETATGAVERKFFAPSGNVMDLAFTAMASWQLGRHDAARTTMRELESIAAAGSLRVPAQVLASIEEARSLLLEVD